MEVFLIAIRPDDVNFSRKGFWSCDLVHTRRARIGLRNAPSGLIPGGGEMAVIQDVVERHAIESQETSKTHDLFSIAVFCGLGLLVSLSVLLLDQHIPGDWF
jgi:hypothetical protein